MLSAEVNSEFHSAFSIQHSEFLVMDYKQSGVDIDAGNEVVRRIRSLARGTFTPGVLSEIGSFGGLFRLGDAGGDDPVLVASADGVGTKLRVAFMTGIHTTIGADLVNHCVNDILVQGAQPLFFLDYLATGRLDPDVAVQIVDGLAQACRANGCALLGGETAEMPGFYADGEYDVAGFIVGVVPRRNLIDGKSIAPGDLLIGVPSSGLHTNGYSLARRIAFETACLPVDAVIPELGQSIGSALLAPHRSYLSLVRPLLGSGLILGMAHITGGGITDNLPRVLPSGTHARVDRSVWQPAPLFTWLQKTGGVPDDDMFRTFNMGIGLILACRRDQEAELLRALASGGEPGAVRIGEIRAGGEGVIYG
jgi:phosphoribosylformylglycinamidine cyclo-ligase